MPSVSAFVLCKNEKERLPLALGCLKWADELIVIDDGSTDGSIEIAQSSTDKVFSYPPGGDMSFAAKRNYALDKCSSDWIFFLDADEICSPELIQWLENFKAGRIGPTWSSSSRHPKGSPELDQIDLYEIRRLEHLRGVLYKYGAGNPSHQWRLFRRRGTKFVGQVHEYPVFKGKIERVEFPILHFPKSTVTDLVNKMNYYTTLEAQQLFEAGKVKTISYMWFSGLAMFLKAYFRKQGFRDGAVGLILAVSEGMSFFTRQAKLYFLNKKAGKL